MLDSTALTRLEYATLDPLTVRIQTHHRYSARPDDIEAAVDEAVNLSRTADLLDVGCGTGSYLRRLAGTGHAGRLAGLDASVAAADRLRDTAGVEAVEGDAQRLPFGDATFDVVTARHMLYHVPDPLQALREARRVLRPGGTLAALVNLEHTMPMLMGLIADSLAEHGLRRPVPAGEVGPGPRFAKVHAGNLPAMVQQIFGYAQVHRHDNELVFDTAEPVVAYTVSCLNGWGVTADHPLRPAVVDTITARAAALFAERSPRRDPKGYVIVTATV